MSDVLLLERKRKMFERYPVWFAVGIAILVVALALMGWRQVNEQARLAEIFAGRGPPNPSSAYLAADRLEMSLAHVIEQLIFVGLAAIKVGIGFSIAVIVLNIRETGKRSLESFGKAGVADSPPSIATPWFAKFPLLLMIGFSIVTLFFLLTSVWVYNEYVPIGDQVTSRMTLEAIIKPGKMIGTALLLFGIAGGLAAIVLNLRMQSLAVPKLLVAAAKRTKLTAGDLTPGNPPFPGKLFIPLVIGLAVVITAYVPVAAVLAGNRAANLSTVAGVPTWSPPGAESLEVVLEHWIESYVLTGIVIILFGIGLWLLTIIRWLRAQREGFVGAYASFAGAQPPAAPKPLRLVKMVPLFLLLGLGVAVFSLLLTGFWIGAGLQAGETGARSAIVADHVWEAFVKPFKFVGLAFVFLGIGVALSAIVINLQMVAMALPGVLARFGEAARGQATKPLDMPAIDPMSLFPKKLFAGILAGFVIVVTSTLPLAWLLRIGTFDVFLGANLAANAAAQAAFAFERVMEHLILPYKLTGVGIILVAIGRYFNTIIGFVRARKVIITEGVDSLLANLSSPA